MKKFITRNYKHYNARTLKNSADSWINHINNNGKVLLAMGGAMSTAEIGISLAKAIREDKVHAISTTGANLEEDIFNLLAGDTYQQIDKWDELTVEDETHLENRVLDVCIPESVMRETEEMILPLWQKASDNLNSYFPHEYFFQLLDTPRFKDIDLKDSWVAAAKEKKIPVYVAGWEDSTIGNMLVSNLYKKTIPNFNMIKSGLEYMQDLVDWYYYTSLDYYMGFFQIGGGISGDFPVCVVPLINCELAEHFNKVVPFWKYYCQISDGHTSFGSYSQADCNEKISWGKLGKDSKMYSINSDATIVFPLIVEYITE
tara:strand:+ start:16925 stop:17869 length:945 start_codon:yes stop_codon:yes gene_type:complete